MLRKAGTFIPTPYEKVWGFIWDILFPIFCVKCGQEGVWLCEKCLVSFGAGKPARCPVCGTDTAGGGACENCRSSSFLDGIIALFEYKEDDPLSDLIKFFKYNFAREIEKIFDELISKNLLLGDLSRFSRIEDPDWSSGGFGKGNFVIAPVPLHKRKLRERGFNQSEILALSVSKVLGKPIENLLQRGRYTKQQAKLSGEERRINLKDAFRITGGRAVPRDILLVDDVFTTGATMQECAKVLKANGAKRVWGFVLARG